MRISFARIAASVAVMAYFELVLCSGLDRLVAQDVTSPALANWGYGVNDSLRAAKAAAGRHNWQDAAQAMSRALLADPVSESTVGALGLVRLQAGDLPGADAAFRVSAMRGWRDLPTHLYWLQTSIAAGDLDSAATQGDALLRGQADAATKAKVIDALLQYQEGRNALAIRLRTNPPWAVEFAGFDNLDHVSLDHIAGRAEVVALGGRGVVHCGDVSYLVSRLFGAELLDQAIAVHSAACPNAASPVNDPQFALLASGQPATLLDWQAHSDGDSTIAPAYDGTGHLFHPPHVHLLVSGASTALVLTQPIIVPAGDYRIGWAMPDTDAGNIPALTASLDCNTDLGKSAPGLAVAGQAARYATTVHFSGGCAAPTLAFWLTPGHEVNLADVGVVRQGAADGDVVRQGAADGGVVRQGAADSGVVRQGARAEHK